MQRSDQAMIEALSAPARESIWIALVAASSVLFSLALACATPFAAIATIAGMKMSRRNGLILVFAAWLANQAVGYLVLGYPLAWDSFAWGGAIGIAALLATCGVIEVRRRAGSVAAVSAAFILAFAIYEAALFAATAMLPSGEGAFALAVVIRIFAINAAALAGLLLLHRGALTVGLLSAPQSELSGLRA
jgi:hypothetical protein